MAYQNTKLNIYKAFSPTVEIKSLRLVYNCTKYGYLMNDKSIYFGLLIKQAI